MRRIHIFLIVLIVMLAVLLTLALVSWYYSLLYPNSYMNSWMNQMWGGSSSYDGLGGMMGGGTTTSISYLWIIPLILGVGVAISIFGVAFYLAFPELRYIKGNSICSPASISSGAGKQPADSAVEMRSSAAAGANSAEVVSSCDVLLKTMTPEEQKVLNVLIAHNGKYLQKYVVKESGLSRLKTHRIVARFAKRGIVTVKEFGNTNEIVVSDWVTS